VLAEIDLRDQRFRGRAVPENGIVPGGGRLEADRDDRLFSIPAPPALPAQASHVAGVNEDGLRFAIAEDEFEFFRPSGAPLTGTANAAGAQNSEVDREQVRCNWASGIATLARRSATENEWNSPEISARTLKRWNQRDRDAQRRLLQTGRRLYSALDSASTAKAPRGPLFSGRAEAARSGSWARLAWVTLYRIVRNN